MSRPSNLPILGTNTPPTTGTGVTVPPEIWAGMQQLFAAFGPSASNSLPSSVATPALNHAQLTSSPALPDHNNLTTPLVQSPPYRIQTTSFYRSSMIQQPQLSRVLSNFQMTSMLQR
ncbi:hypothetical protein KEM48_013762 [Puccinia striiformis f. sp. tritici PST-130]|nr:hypothetical protein KEM48_013762 [Puccinia striiformis f. sp. tritici PST-130]